MSPDELTAAQRDEATAGIRACYVAAGLAEPERILWVRSPLVGQLVALARALDVETGPYGRRLPRLHRAMRLAGAWTVAVTAPVAMGVVFFGGVMAAVSWLAFTVQEGNASASNALWVGLFGAAVGIYATWSDGWKDWPRQRALLERKLAERPIDRARSTLAETRRRILTATRPGPGGARSGGAQPGPAWTAIEAGMRQEMAADHAILRQESPGSVTTLVVAMQGTTVDVTLSTIAPLRGDVWWWAHPRFALACEPPTHLHLTHPAPGTTLPHHARQPAVVWADGFQLYFWHGTHLPSHLVHRDWDIDTLLAHRNSEVRRALIERMGWLTFIERAGLRLLHSAPDPGNRSHELQLYDDPHGRLGDVRILVMTNGSPRCSGELLRYAETVPARFDDPVAAAAWQYDCPVEVYRRLQRRT
jgi:hypothetical protein